MPDSRLSLDPALELGFLRLGKLLHLPTSAKVARETETGYGAQGNEQQPPRCHDATQMVICFGGV